MVVLRTVVATAGLLAASTASAHVSLLPTTAVAGAYQVLRFGVGHGCDGAATTALRIEIPPGVSAARPQPKPGWTLKIEHPAGKPEVVTAIVWRGGLPPDQFEEFVMRTKLPATGDALAFPAVQTCGAKEARWTETVVPGGARPEHPAPILTLTPAAPPEGGHDHHH